MRPCAVKRIQDVHCFCVRRATQRTGGTLTCAAACLSAAFFLWLTVPACAAKTAEASHGKPFGSPLTAAPADPAISRALTDVSAAHIRQTISTLVDFRTRNTLSSMDTDLPPGTGVTAAASWIEQQFTAISDACHGCLEVKTDTFTEPGDPGPRSRIKVPTTITNVYAILRGSDPAQASRMYLVTGHYDSRRTDVMDSHGIAPGANDDGSGTAVSIECARVLSRHRWPATIVFVAVAGEEQGLNGSSHLAKLAKEQGWQLGGALNNDIVGGDTTPGDTLQDKTRLRVFSQGIPATATPDEVKRTLALGLESDGHSRELARVVTSVGRTYFRAGTFRPVLEFRLDRYLRGGDHFSFNQQGFAAVRFTEWRENFDHQHQDVRVENGKEYGDLLKFVDFNYVANVARLNAATLATLASAPAAPEQVRIVTSNLDNNSTLRWKPGPGMPAAAHFDILWRDTSAPDWQFHQPVPAADAANGAENGAEPDSMTLPVSKDNVIFGVRACNTAGQCSPAVAPLPER
jgi:Peptidase family M28